MAIADPLFYSDNWSYELCKLTNLQNNTEYSSLSALSGSTVYTTLQTKPMFMLEDGGSEEFLKFS
jgi:hypothetical protein